MTRAAVVALMLLIQPAAAGDFNEQSYSNCEGLGFTMKKWHCADAASKARMALKKMRREEDLAQQSNDPTVAAMHRARAKAYEAEAAVHKNDWRKLKP